MTEFHKVRIQCYVEGFEDGTFSTTVEITGVKDEAEAEAFGLWVKDALTEHAPKLPGFLKQPTKQ